MNVPGNDGNHKTISEEFSMLVKSDAKSNKNMQEIEITDIDTAKSKECHIIGTIYTNLNSYSYFFHNHMVNNVPCIIKNITLEWGCTKNWVVNDTINISYFIENYGSLTAPVANCDVVEYDAQSKTEMIVCDYMDYLNNQDKREGLLYLKDWHLRKSKPDDQFYQVPFYFASDWLNEIALDRKEDDFMFVYIGPKKSWTPLHVDVYHSYSWSVNIVGRKKWILLPPGEETKLKDSFGNLPLLFDPIKNKDVTYYEIVQEQGDAIFVPSGWHHQVVNTLDTISINHNWINACNIEIMWQALQNSMLAVENEIQDLKDSLDFESQCQMILKSLFGMDFLGFVDLLCHIGRKRISQFNGQIYLHFNMFNLGTNHIIFDLKSLEKTLNSISSHPLFVKNYLPQQLKNDVNTLMESISNIILL